MSISNRFGQQAHAGGAGIPTGTGIAGQKYHPRGDQSSSQFSPLSPGSYFLHCWYKLISKDIFCQAATSSSLWKRFFAGLQISASTNSLSASSEPMLTALGQYTHSEYRQSMPFLSSLSSQYCSWSPMTNINPKATPATSPGTCHSLTLPKWLHHPRRGMTQVPPCICDTIQAADDVAETQST